MGPSSVYLAQYGERIELMSRRSRYRQHAHLPQPNISARAQSDADGHGNHRTGSGMDSLTAQAPRPAAPFYAAPLGVLASIRRLTAAKPLASEVVSPTSMLTARGHRGDGLGAAVLTADVGGGAGRRGLFEPESSAP